MCSHGERVFDGRYVATRACEAREAPYKRDGEYEAERNHGTAKHGWRGRNGHWEAGARERGRSRIDFNGGEGRRDT